MRSIDADALLEECAKFVARSNRSDYISAPTWNDAISLIDSAPTISQKTDEWCTDCKEYDQERHCCPRFNRVIRATVEEVKANFTPKTGRWIEQEKGIHLTKYRCSECGRVVWDDVGYDVCRDYPYCHCGARMEEVGE